MSRNGRVWLEHSRSSLYDAGDTAELTFIIGTSWEVFTMLRSTRSPRPELEYSAGPTNSGLSSHSMDKAVNVHSHSYPAASTSYYNSGRALVLELEMKARQSACGYGRV
jgi:hypothetical protein